MKLLIEMTFFLLMVPATVACYWFDVLAAHIRQLKGRPRLDDHLRRSCELRWTHENPGADPRLDRTVLYSDGCRWRRWESGVWHVEPEIVGGVQVDIVRLPDGRHHFTERWTDEAGQTHHEEWTQDDNRNRHSTWHE